MILLSCVSVCFRCMLLYSRSIWFNHFPSLQKFFMENLDIYDIIDIKRQILLPLDRDSYHYSRHSGAPTLQGPLPRHRRGKSRLGKPEKSPGLDPSAVWDGSLGPRRYSSRVKDDCRDSQLVSTPPSILPLFIPLLLFPPSGDYA